MASRTLNHRALREQSDRAAAIEQEAGEPEESSTPEPKAPKTRKRKVAGEKAVKVKAAAKPRTRKAKAPPRQVARWAVCDGGLKRLAVFEYKDRAGADAKLTQLREQQKGPFVLQLVKDLYEPVEPVAAVEPVIAV